MVYPSILLRVHEHFNLFPSELCGPILVLVLWSVENYCPFGIIVAFAQLSPLVCIGIVPGCACRLHSIQ